MEKLLYPLWRAPDDSADGFAIACCSSWGRNCKLCRAYGDQAVCGR